MIKRNNHWYMTGYCLAGQKENSSLLHAQCRGATYGDGRIKCQCICHDEEKPVKPEKPVKKRRKKA